MPEKKVVTWSPDAQAEIRAIDRETAVRILHAIDRYLTTGTGDVIKLQPHTSIEILHVRHRREAYQ
jgi:hypothetical protein